MTIGFHYFPEYVPGGYIAVDSFFVISGYLITGIIKNSMKAGDFSFIDFYARRIKRLFPTFLVVLIFSFVVTWAGASAADLREIGYHILSGSFFYANFRMASEVDYFAKAAEYKPLLILWSLAVEEQFYFTWPAILVLFNKFRVNLKFATGLLILVFFYVAYQANATYLSQNYFYPHIRFWEILAGCFLAINSHAVEDLSFRTKSIFSVSGLVLLITSLLTITRPDPLQIILPVAGTILLILAGKDTWLNRKILSFPGLVKMGLVSYSFYLWHWPLLSFVRIIFSHQPDELEKFGLITLSFLLSYISYRFLEFPSRRSNSKVLAVALLIGISIMGILGYISSHTMLISPRTRVIKSDGKLKLFYEKLAKEPYMHHHNAVDRAKVIRRGQCHYRWTDIASFEPHLPKLYNCLNIDPQRPNIVITGDSYAADLHAAFVRSHPQYNFLQQTGGGCTFGNDPSEDCNRMIEYAVSFSELNKVDAVILAAKWNENFPSIEKLTKRLQKANRKVIISGPVPIFKNVIPDVLAKNWKEEDLQTIVRKQLAREPFDLNNRIKKFAQNAGAAYIDRMQLYCHDSEYCEVLSDKGDLLLLDASHLSVQGIDYLGKRLLEEKVLESILKK